MNNGFSTDRAWHRWFTLCVDLTLQFSINENRTETDHVDQTWRFPACETNCVFQAYIKLRGFQSAFQWQNGLFKLATWSTTLFTDDASGRCTLQQHAFAWRMVPEISRSTYCATIPNQSYKFSATGHLNYHAILDFVFRYSSNSVELKNEVQDSSWRIYPEKTNKSLTFLSEAQLANCTLVRIAFLFQTVKSTISLMILMASAAVIQW